jgi:hypothetical protein
MRCPPKGALSQMQPIVRGNLARKRLNFSASHYIEALSQGCRLDPQGRSTVEDKPQEVPEKPLPMRPETSRFVRFLQLFSPRTLGGAMTLLLIAVLAAVGIFLAYQYIVKAQETEILRQIVARLERERRVAQVIVRDQKTDASGTVLVTTLKFAELQPDGSSLPPKTIIVPGEEVYFDALVIKFDYQYVELGDSLRGKSICLFRKVFGSGEKPEDGFAIDEDSEDGIPNIYRTGRQVTPFEIRVWRRFWEYADNARMAKEEGVRVAQIEAVGIRPRPERIYTISVENAGGLNITAEEIPAILKEGKDSDSSYPVPVAVNSRSTR